MTDYSQLVTFAIAKQIAVFNGQIFDKLAGRQRAALMTLANSILATVQRLQRMEDGR